MRTLPPDLVEQLRTAVRLEQLADGLHRHRDAISATSALMLAAVDAGWYRTEIAAALAMKQQTVAQRVATARQRFGDARPGIEVTPAPTSRRTTPRPTDVLRQPVQRREWLSRAEAAEHAGCDTETIANWRRRGLLPNTQHPTPAVYLYLRADLQRVMRAPRYNNVGVDYAALRAQIEASAV